MCKWWGCSSTYPQSAGAVGSWHVPSGSGPITLLMSAVEIVNKFDTMLQMIVFSQVCVVGWILLFPYCFFFNQVPVAVIWSVLVGSLIRSLNWDAILQMDSTGVCSFLTNPVMELSCCRKGSQGLFTAVLKDLSLMKAAVIQVPTECLSYSCGNSPLGNRGHNDCLPRIAHLRLFAA